MKISQGTELDVTSQLVIYPDEKGRFHLAWKLSLFSEQPLLNWFYIVDAQSGAVLKKLNGFTDVTGDGDVFPTHPYLSSFSNKNLYRLDGNNRLQGKYAYIVNDAASEAYSATHSFVYSPSNSHFDEVNLYYHIDNFRHNYIGQLDDGSLNFEQITAHAHTPIQDLDNDGDLDPNAWFSRGNQDLYFNGASTYYNDFAKEDKVIHHEYGHAVIYDIQSGIASWSNEEGAISEGTPDYWAGAFTDRSIIGDYITGNPSGIRDMANPYISSYSEYQNDDNSPPYGVEPHKGGEFFSAILWDLHSEIGESKTNTLVYEALFYVTGNPDFLGFRDAMMTADDAIYAGNNNDDIQNTFADWGVGSSVPPPPPPPSLEVTISGPNSVNSGQSALFSANVLRADGPVSYQWFYRKPGESLWTFTLGTSSSFSHTFYGSAGYISIGGVKVKVTSAGETDIDILNIAVYGEGCEDGPGSGVIEPVPCD